MSLHQTIWYAQQTSIDCSILYYMTKYVLDVDVTSPPAAPGTPTLSELSNELDSIVNWYSLGVKLGIKGHELDTIGIDYHGDNTRCKHNMLSRWLRVTELPTWKAVMDALCLMGEHAVASKICQKYCSSTTATGKSRGSHLYVPCRSVCDLD